MPTSRLNSPLVLLTMGDSRGIGPEVIVRSLALKSIRDLADILVIGDIDCLKKIKALLKIPVPLNEIYLWELVNSKKVMFDKRAINILDLKEENQQRAPLRYVDEAVMLLNNKRASALVTAPVNKGRIAKSGVKFSGHTEYLAGITKTKDVAMMFAAGKIRVTTVTRHIPLKDVSKALTKKRIINTALLTYNYLRYKFNIRRPRIGVCALNPHAGEGGEVGREEEIIIKPAIKMLKRKIRDISGPIPSDSAFSLLYNNKRFDCLIAMYHDQAMIPVKMLDRDSSVNVTLGLPFVRTSPAHGTAYDIAGKGIANPSSMIEAIKLASVLAKRC